MRYGIPFDSTKHCCGVHKGLWPGNSIGASPPNPLPHSRGGSWQTCAAGGWKHRLGLCLHLTQQGPISCAPIKQGTCQCHDGWHAQYRSPGPAPPVANMQIIVTQGCSGMPGRFEWKTWGLAVYLPGAATLECCCPNKPAHKPQLIEVDLSSMQPESVTTNILVPTTAPVLPPSLANTVETPGDITMAINLQLQGTLEWLQQTSPPASAPVSQHRTLRKEPPPVTLGASPSTREREDPIRPEGMDSAIPAPTAIIMQMPPWVATPGSTPSFTHITHLLLQPTMPKTPEVVSTCTFPPRVVPTKQADKLLPLQGRMNTELEWLLTNRALGISAAKSWT